MYRYDHHDQRLVDERVAQFRDQTRRFLAGELSEDEFRPLRLQNGLYIQKYAPMLRVANKGAFHGMPEIQLMDMDATGSLHGQVAFRLLARLITRLTDVAEQVERLGNPGPGDPVQRPAGHDLVQPGRKAGMSPEAGQLLPRGNQRFLGDVLSVVMVAEQTQRDPVGQPAMPVNEFGVGVYVTFLGPLDQVVVIDI